jgi:hypothetical protein
MKRTLLTVLACAAFLAMLTATSKKRPPREAGSIPKITSIPETTGWARHEVAGIRFATPPSAVVTRGEQLAEIRIQVPGSFAFGFATQAIDIAQAKTVYEQDFLMYEAADAVLALSEMRSGDDCRVVACSTKLVFGAPLCIDTYTDTNAACADIVAIARSIEPL